MDHITERDRVIYQARYEKFVQWMANKMIHKEAKDAWLACPYSMHVIIWNMVSDLFKRGNVVASWDIDVVEKS